MTPHNRLKMTGEANGRVRVEIPLPYGSYTLIIQEGHLGDLATGILSGLGCSYEIKWPEHEAGWGGQQKVLADAREDADEYADVQVHRLWTWMRGDELLQERMREAFRDAFLSGWHHAPKPVTFPISRALWKR